MAALEVVVVNGWGHAWPQTRDIRLMRGPRVGKIASFDGASCCTVMHGDAR